MKRIILIILPFLYLFILLAQQDKALTQDLGRHIKTGQVILECICVPKTNLYSFTEPLHPFINHHWLPEVMFYLLNSLGGAGLIVLVKVLTITLAFGTVYLYAFFRYSRL